MVNWKYVYVWLGSPVAVILSLIVSRDVFLSVFIFSSSSMTLLPSLFLQRKAVGMVVENPWLLGSSGVMGRWFRGYHSGTMSALTVAATTVFLVAPFMQGPSLGGVTVIIGMFLSLISLVLSLFVFVVLKNTRDDAYTEDITGMIGM